MLTHKDSRILIGYCKGDVVLQQGNQRLRFHDSIMQFSDALFNNIDDSNVVNALIICTMVG